MLTKLRQNYDTILNYPLTPRAHSSYARIHHGRHTRSPGGTVCRPFLRQHNFYVQSVETGAPSRPEIRAAR